LCSQIYEENGRRAAIDLIDSALYLRAFGEDADNLKGDMRILLELIRS